MLTITETIDAIRALNTDEDVILGACKRIVNKDQASSDVDVISCEIIEVYRKRVKHPGDLIDALCTSLAITASLAVEEGHEVSALHGIIEMISNRYLASVKELIAKRMLENPQEGIKTLLRAMEGLLNYKPKAK